SRLNMDVKYDTLVTKESPSFYLISPDWMGRTELRVKRNGKVYRPTLLSTSVFHEEANVKVEQGLKRRICIAVTPVEVRMIVNGESISSISDYKKQEMKISLRIPKKIWRASSIAFWTMVILSFGVT